MNRTKDELTSKVELSISCKGLAEMDVLSKSDPFAVLSEKMNSKYSEIGRTETIKNNNNPVFSKKFVLDYRFEERQQFRVDLYDMDKNTTNLNCHDYLGYLEFNLGQVVSRQNWETYLIPSQEVASFAKHQTIILSCLELSDCKEKVSIRFSGHKLDKKDFLGKSDPYLEFWREETDTKFKEGDDYRDKQAELQYCKFSLVHRTQPIMNTLNPDWPVVKLMMNQFCVGDEDRLIKIICYDWNSNGSSDLIGEFYTSVNHLTNNMGKPDFFKLYHPRKAAKKKNYDNSGYITVRELIRDIEYSFFDYISGGTELHFSVAIDFTASNGDPRKRSSLHFIDNSHLNFATNQYEVAISSVGAILEDYDENRHFASMGFGAKLGYSPSCPDGQISHCFPLSHFLPPNNNELGVMRLLSEYRNTIRHIKLFGPTYFEPSIKNVMHNYANQCKDGSKYFVLLIITDGVITDFEKTINAIVDASFLPMSIIIVGVGDDDFTAMDALDCDNGYLRSGRKVASRDIVQFVALRDFIDKNYHHTGAGSRINQEALARAVLHELPKQLVLWMSNNNIKPLPRRQPLYPSPNIAETALSYPGQIQNSAPPYPGQGQPRNSAPPYPGQPGNSAPPYPGQGQPGNNAPPYPGQGQPGNIAPPYPGQGQPGNIAPPYPGQGLHGTNELPYPGQSQYKHTGPVQITDQPDKWL